MIRHLQKCYSQKQSNVFISSFLKANVYAECANLFALYAYNDFIKAGVKLRNRPKIYVKIAVSVKFQSASYTYAKHTPFNSVAV